MIITLLANKLLYFVGKSRWFGVIWGNIGPYKNFMVDTNRDQKINHLWKKAEKINSRQTLCNDFLKKLLDGIHSNFIENTKSITTLKESGKKLDENGKYQIKMNKNYIGIYKSIAQSAIKNYSDWGKK